MKKGFILYRDSYSAIKDLSLEEKGTLLDAIFQYNIDETIPILNPVVKVAFGFLKEQFDRDKSKWSKEIEKRRSAGKLGGEARARNAKQIKQVLGMPSKSSKSKQVQANQGDNVNVNVNVNDNVNVSDNVTTRKLAPQAVFIEKFSELYNHETSQKYKHDKKDFVLVAKLIKEYGAGPVNDKAKILFSFCKAKSEWFTKGGMADFTIGKLSSQWNSLIKKTSHGDGWVKNKEKELVNDSA